MVLNNREAISNGGFVKLDKENVDEKTMKARG